MECEDQSEREMKGDFEIVSRVKQQSASFRESGRGAAEVSH